MPFWSRPKKKKKSAHCPRFHLPRNHLRGGSGTASHRAGNQEWEGVARNCQLLHDGDTHSSVRSGDGREGEAPVLFSSSRNACYGGSQEVPQPESLNRPGKPTTEYIVSGGGVTDPGGPLALREAHSFCDPRVPAFCDSRTRSQARSL